MANNISLVVFPTKDLGASKKFFNEFLGTEPYVDGEWYVGYKTTDKEIGLDPNGQAVIAYTDTNDIEASLKSLQEAGAEVAMEPKDVGGGVVVAKVTVDGNTLGLRQLPA